VNDKVCIDASLALIWLLPAEQDETASIMLRKWDEEGMEIITAPLFHAEVTSVLRAQVYFEKLLPEEGEEAFSVYLEMGVKSVDNPEIQRKAWELTKRFNLPRTYDM